MTGNVLEWTSTISPTPYVPIINVPLEYRVEPDGTKVPATFYYLKGGSCMHGYRNSRLESLTCFGEGYRNWHLGMRLAL